MDPNRTAIDLAEARGLSPTFEAAWMYTGLSMANS
jgi:hypothetical protein